MESNANPWRFSIRAILGLTVMLSAFLGLAVWIDWVGSLMVFMFVSGVFGVAEGVMRKRSSMMAIGIVCAAVPLCTLWYDVTNVAVWDGYYSLNVRVKVIDADTGKPVPMAEVGVCYKAWEAEYGFPTDDSGEAMCMTEQMCSGRWSGLQITDPYKPFVPKLNWYLVHVRADGYEPVSIPLNDATGEERWDTSGSMLDATVALRKYNR